VTKDLLEQFSLYGEIEELNKIFMCLRLYYVCLFFNRYRLLDNYPCEEFTDVFYIRYRNINDARMAKRKLDNYYFFSKSLHVCYSPEYESINDVRYKLNQRKKIINEKIASCVHDTSINKPIIRSHDTSVPSIESAGKVPLVYTSVPPLLSTNVPSLISTVASPIKNTSVPSLISISVPPLISNVPPLIYTSVPPLISTNVLSTSKLPSKHISILSSPPPLIKSTNAKNISSIVYPSVNATTVNETYPVNKSSSSSSSQLSVIKDISHVQHVQCFLEENQPTGDKRVIKRKPVIVNKQLQTHQKPTTLTNSNDVILVKPIVKEDSLSSSSSSVDVTIKSVRRKMTQVS
jgi:hypothetical protein